MSTLSNDLLILKIRERLNMLSSGDYDNLEKWQIQEAFNKVQIEFARRIIQPKPGQVGDEQTKGTVDDLQFLITAKPLKGKSHPEFFESDVLPVNYMAFKRVSAEAASDCCPPRKLVIYQGEEANRDELLRDEHTKPSFEWAETFITMLSNRIRIYTDGEFKIHNPELSYYRFPRTVIFEGTVDTETGLAGTDQTCEFKRDIAEILADETAALLAADLNSVNQFQRNLQNAQRNT